MRLFLSSYHFGNYGSELVRLAPRRSVAYIGNAKDEYSLSERQMKVAESRLDFENLGFEFDEVDLREYFESSHRLEDLIRDKGLIWLAGGNTFLLRRALKDSGLDKIITKLVKSDKIAYGGSSAGAIIPTPSIRGTESGDDPSAVGRVYGKEVIWDGLGLVDFYVVPHYKSEWFSDESKAMKKYFEENNLPHYPLEDGQVYLVDGTRRELLK